MLQEGMSSAQEEAKRTRTAQVIEVLNRARSMELYSVQQYMIQHYTLDNMDYGEFAGKIKLIAIDEMRHAEQFAERIKELGGETCQRAVVTHRERAGCACRIPF